MYRLSESPAYIFIPVIMGGVLLITIWISIFVLRNKRLAVEKGLKPLAQSYCGIVTDGFRATVPLVRVSLYEEFFVISCIFTLQYRYDAVTSLTLKKGFLFERLRFRAPTSGLCISGWIDLLAFRWEQTFLAEFFSRCGLPVPNVGSD